MAADIPVRTAYIGITIAYNTIYLIVGTVIHREQWDRDTGRPPWEFSLQKQQSTNYILDGKLLQIVGAATLKAREVVTVLTRFGTTSKCEFDDRRVLAGW